MLRVSCADFLYIYHFILDNMDNIVYSSIRKETSDESQYVQAARPDDRAWDVEFRIGFGC